MFINSTKMRHVSFYDVDIFYVFVCIVYEVLFVLLILKKSLCAIFKIKIVLLYLYSLRLKGKIVFKKELNKYIYILVK